MRNVFRKLWSDDKGAVIAPELILIVALTVIGIIPGLVALRNSSNSALGNLSNALLSINDGYSFSSYSISQAAGETGERKTIAVVAGSAYTPDIEALQSHSVLATNSADEVEVAP